MDEIVIFLLLLAVGYGAGTAAERKHFASIVRRERALLNLPALTLKGEYPEERVQSARLVAGSVVISVDYFKRFAAALRSFFGGRVAVYESLIDRARREAMLRMKEDSYGADMIVNVRLDTSSIGGEMGGRNAVASVEAIAYGTAITLNKAL